MSEPRRGVKADRAGDGFWAGLALPGVVWLCVFFLLPFYVVLCVALGSTDPILLIPRPEWNPLEWNTSAFEFVLDGLFTPGAAFETVFVRTLVYVVVATTLSLLIAYPVAYYVARYGGRWKGLLLMGLIAPFFISYLMRMLAWINLLQDDGWVNKVLQWLGILNAPHNWLDGRASSVILGLVYGYVPYMILPLYAGLDRLPQPMLEASRDLGADRFSSFWRVTLPLCRPTILAAVLLTCLPMLGDYFTSDMLSASPKTAMVGNLINDSVHAPGRTGQAGAFVMLVFLVALLPMLYYIRVTSRRSEMAS